MIGTRIEIHGPPVRLQPPAAQAIGMALHELATNASKYGALSDESGRLRVTWSMEGEGDGREFLLSWEEKDGPEVTPPERRGFGYTIMVAMVEKSLDANRRRGLRADRPCLEGPRARSVHVRGTGNSRPRCQAQEGEGRGRLSERAQPPTARPCT